MENTNETMRGLGGVATSAATPFSPGVASPAASLLAHLDVGFGALRPSQFADAERGFGLGVETSSDTSCDSLPPLEAMTGNAQTRTTDLGVASMPLNSDDDSDISPPSPPSRIPPRPVSLRIRKAPPTSEDDDTDSKPRAGLKRDSEETIADCCICMSKPSPGEAASVNGCDHVFCFGCIEKWAERENTCPLCKNRFTDIKRLNGEGQRKKVKTRDQKADLMNGNTLETLLGMAPGAFPSFARLLVSGMTEIPGAPMRRPDVSVEFSSTRTSADSRLPRTFRMSTRFSAAAMPPPHGFDEADAPPNPFDDEGYSSFVQSVRNARRATRSAGTATIYGTYSVPRGFAYVSSQRVRTRTSTNSLAASLFGSPSPAPAPARNFAINSDQAGAGVTRENALEIEDDSDDEEVELLHVSRPVG